MRQPVLFLLLLAIFMLAIWPIGGYILVFCSFILALQKGEGRELGQIFVNDWALWLLTGVFWLSAILSGNLIVTFIGGLLFSLQIILYLLVRVYLTGKYCSKAIDLLILAGCIVALYGLGQYFFLNDGTQMAWLDKNVYGEINKRVFSTLYNPNVLGSYLVIIISLTLGKVCTAFRWHNLLYFAVLIVSYLCLFFTFSRGAWLAMFLSLLALFIFYRKKRNLLFVLVILVLIILPASGQIAERMSLQLFTEDMSSLYRLQIWEGSWKIIQNNWLLGVGPGNFSSALAHYLPVKPFVVFHAHNTYLHVLSETGILGFLATSLFYGQILWRAYRCYSISGNAKIASLSLAILVGLLGILIHGCVDATLVAPQFTVFFWILAALVYNLDSKS